MAMPIPKLQLSSAAGPSSASGYGDTGDMGTMTVGDYFARGSRVRQGSGWQEYGTVGVVALVGLGLWLWMR